MSEIMNRLDEMEKQLDEFVENANTGVPENVRKEIDAAIEADYEADYDDYEDLEM